MSNYRGVTDANINLSDCSTQREENPLFKRPRKQQQPKKIVPTTEIQVIRRSPKRRRKNQPIDYISQLRDKHISRLIMRKGLRCFWCRSWSEVFPYHTYASLVLHKMWHHRRDKFGCEHCNVRYRHRYQVVLHSSRAHLPRHVSDQIAGQSPKPPGCQIPMNTVENALRETVPVSSDILSLPPPPSPPPIATALTEVLSQNDKVEGTPIADASTLSSDVEDMKIPNFLTSLQDLQTNQFDFRSPDLYTATKSLQNELDTSKPDVLSESQEIKTYHLFNKMDGGKCDEDITDMEDLSNLNKPVGDEMMVENLDGSMTPMNSNNNVIPRLEMSDKTSQNTTVETPQIQDLISSSGLTENSGPMPLVIPSYPPSR
ncbi:hypothetical protein RUM44_010826 [Polyplax serrata]|uniref:C2H2-type domain-containing protein n=1 Tax=Polyplax serrata TaxID=468196 RepID=A0ABR1ANL2_POLSC